MKIRTGFVSNSSSSSFICDITGETYTSWDAGLEEAEMYECERGHVFLEEFLIGEVPDDCEDSRYEVPTANCPICSFTHIMEDGYTAYIAKFHGITYDGVRSFMKSKNSRLRKVRNIYWIEFLEATKGISKIQLDAEIKSKYNSLEDFYKALK